MDQWTTISEEEALTIRGLHVGLSAILTQLLQSLRFQSSTLSV